MRVASEGGIARVARWWQPEVPDCFAHVGRDEALDRLARERAGGLAVTHSEPAQRPRSVLEELVRGGSIARERRGEIRGLS